jgi:hypothetical protein
MCCLNRPEDGGRTYLWNVGRYSIKNTVVHPRRFWASYSPPWELEIFHSCLLLRSGYKGCRRFYCGGNLVLRMLCWQLLVVWLTLSGRQTVLAVSMFDTFVMCVCVWGLHAMQVWVKAWNNIGMANTGVLPFVRGVDFTSNDFSVSVFIVIKFRYQVLSEGSMQMVCCRWYMR